MNVVMHVCLFVCLFAVVTSNCLCLLLRTSFFVLYVHKMAI